jgi:tetratricopeptide (TPR) repeat protein
MEGPTASCEQATDLLKGAVVAVAGRLAYLSLAALKRLVAAHGGTFSTRLGRDTTLLIIGLSGLPLRGDGRLSGKLRRARRMLERGAMIELVREDEFFERFGLTEGGESVGRCYTLRQVAKVTGSPVERIGYWVQSGILQPAEYRLGIPLFSFREISSVKRLQELMAAGVTPARLRQSLGQLEAWLPDAPEWLSRLELIAGGNRLATRSSNGLLVQVDGQMLFDFVDHSQSHRQMPDAVPFRAPSDSEQLFQRALDCERQGDCDEAVLLYRDWLMAFGPDAQVCFNLGNALFALGRFEGAAERFRQSLEIDPDYAEAWSNLGCALAELGEIDEAAASLRRALSLAPDYADAIYNLADILERAGRSADARPHWLAYLDHDDTSPWAEHARERLRVR